MNVTEMKEGSRSSDVDPGKPEYSLLEDNRDNPHVSATSVHARIGSLHFQAGHTSGEQTFKCILDMIMTGCESNIHPIIRSG